MPEKKSSVSQLAELLKDSGARICFCTQCSHQKEYGYCWSCHCHNHLPEPELNAEMVKMKKTIERWQELATRYHQQYGEKKAG